MQARVNPADSRAMHRLTARLPKGYTMGPLKCPIGLDEIPQFCSAGYCVLCQWLYAHRDKNPHVEMDGVRAALSAPADAGKEE